MIVSYCKKCKVESEGSVCQQCGKRATASSTRDVWHTIRVPGADGSAWCSGVAALLWVVIILLISLLLIERMNTTANRFAGSMSSLISGVAIAGVIGLLLCLAAFSLQGREEIRYILDMDGAHMQVWYRASPVHALARLQRISMKSATPSRDGTKYVKAEERFLHWRDVNEIRCSPSTGTIRLYRVPHLAPFILRIPPEEYELAEALVKKHAKKNKR